MYPRLVTPALEEQSRKCHVLEASLEGQSCKLTIQSLQHKVAQKYAKRDRCPVAFCSRLRPSTIARGFIEYTTVSAFTNDHNASLTRNS